MSDFNSLSIKELQEYKEKLAKQYDDFKAKKLSLDMSRGKPCSEQLDLSLGLLNCLGENDYKSTNGTDCRNYGGIEGLPEARELFGKILDVEPKEVLISGNSSLNIMHDTIARALIFGVVGSDQPWGKQPIKFLCPAPGYDRHFAICEFFGIEMINITLNNDGPDMDMVEKLVAEDETIKGMWCVPKYSNPTGITYSDEVVDRLAKMETKAKDFRIFWDNAYAIHHLTDKPDQLKNILTACKEAGNPDRVFMFASTAKVSFAGAGISMIAASETNLNFMKKQISIQTIGPDKINQLRHVRFFKTFENIEKHMQKHAAIIKPKFDMVVEILERELGGKNIANWNNPNGGYFINFDGLNGCAKAIVKMAADAGVTLTGAGASFPYGKDPLDSNIRIAPTFPPLNELKTAMELFAICVQLVSIDKLLSERA